MQRVVFCMRAALGLSGGGTYALAYRTHVTYRPDFNAAKSSPGEFVGDAHGVFQAVRLDQVEASQNLLRFRKRSIQHGGAALAYTHRLACRRCLQLLRSQQRALCLQLIGMFEASTEKRFWISLYRERA